MCVCVCACACVCVRVCVCVPLNHASVSKESGQSVIFHYKSSTKHIFTLMAALDSVTATVARYNIATHEKFSKNFARRLKTRNHNLQVGHEICYTED